MSRLASFARWTAEGGCPYVSFSASCEGVPYVETSSALEGSISSRQRLDPDRKLRPKIADRLRYRRDTATLLRQALQEVFEHAVEFLRIIDEQCVAVAVESLQSNFVAELRFQ